MTAPNLRDVLDAIAAAPLRERCAWLERAAAWTEAAWSAIAFHGTADNGWARHPDVDRGWDRLGLQLRGVREGLQVTWW